MKVQPHERIDIRRSLADTRLSSRKVYLCVPTFEDDAFDLDDQSANDPSAAGDGTGRTATWVVYAVFCNIRDVDTKLIAFGTVPPGAVLGDTLVSYSTRDKDAFRNAYDNENAYLDIDGTRLRLVGIATSGLGETEEYLGVARRFTPIWTAAGH